MNIKPTKPTKSVIIHTGLIVLLFTIAIFALIFSLSDINCKFLQFSSTAFKEMMGVFISAVALVITAYFVILVIDAYSSVQEIKKIKENIQQDVNEIANEIKKMKGDVQRDVNEMTNQKKELYSLLCAYTQSLYDGLETQIELSERVSKSEKVRNDLYLIQARMSYRYPMLNKQTRIELLRKLHDIGELEDINNVRLLIINPNEDAQIKEYAELVFENLKSKFGIS